MEIYKWSLDAPSHASFRMAVYSNIWFGIAETVMFLIMALAFWYGSTLVREGEYILTQILTVFIAMTFGPQSAGQVYLINNGFDFGSLHLPLTSRKPSLRPVIYSDYWAESQRLTFCRVRVRESTRLRDTWNSRTFVHFRYATRKHVPVLRRLNLIINPGQYVALVGISESRK
jgi:ATP-binding cassette, subfamily B (MDR/TAP), member 1